MAILSVRFFAIQTNGLQRTEASIHCYLTRWLPRSASILLNLFSNTDTDEGDHTAPMALASEQIAALD
jgi:hypothetical protein